MNSMLNNWPIDPAVVIIALGVITLLLMIMTVICIMQTSRLYRRYDYAGKRRRIHGRDYSEFVR